MKFLPLRLEDLLALISDDDDDDDDDDEGLNGRPINTHPPVMSLFSVKRWWCAPGNHGNDVFDRGCACTLPFGSGESRSGESFVSNLNRVLFRCCVNECGLNTIGHLPRRPVSIHLCCVFSAKIIFSSTSVLFLR